MEQKDKVEACIKQAEFWYRLYSGRRDFEWKITLGLWGTILAAISIFISNHIRVNYWWIWIIPPLLHMIWLSGVWVAHKIDKNWMFHFQNEAEYCLVNKDYVVKNKPEILSYRENWNWIRFFTDWSMRFQLFTTTALSILAFLISK